MNMTDFHKQWSNQMNGILSSMYRSPLPITGEVNGQIGPAMRVMYGPPEMDCLPPPIHTLSLNAPPYQYYPREIGQRGKLFAYNFMVNNIKWYDQFYA